MNNIELQAKCINRILRENMDMFNSNKLKNKISYLLWKKDEVVAESINSINNIYRIVDVSIKQENYKKALRYCCIMNNKVCKIAKYANEINTR